jgi:SAM-dependent methyltransferase
MVEIIEAGREVLSKVPPYWRDFWTPQLSRVAEEVGWLFREKGTVVDIGGNVGFHAALCVTLGMRAVVVDNYARTLQGTCWRDTIPQHDEVAAIMRSLGVEFVHEDVLEWEPTFEPGSLEVVCSFDCLEHLKASPRRLFTRLMNCLKPGGRVVLGVPNAANLLKRFEVPLGRNIFAAFHDWYDYPVFIGHVREFIVSDLERVAADLGLEEVRVVGRNWLGRNRVKGQLGCLADHVLRLRPSFCSDIYLLGRKPQG